MTLSTSPMNMRRISSTDLQYAYETLSDYASRAPIIRTSKREEVINIPCAFDIETSSFMNDQGKCAIMYVWQMQIDTLPIFYGRTWDDFHEFIELIKRSFNLNAKRRLYIYVHNLSFEFQFIRKLFEWKKIFAISERKPIYAQTVDGIEFRCSYLLSGYDLATLGTLLKTPIPKMVGDLDYKLIRHSETPLTHDELRYAAHDVMIVTQYIRECIERDGDITRLQLTKTSYVRKYCRDACMYDGSHKKKTWKYLNYRELIDSLTLTPLEYLMAKRAFAGGFTHANGYEVNKTHENVTSYDLSSAYPAAMVAEKFPMSKGRRITIKDGKHFQETLQRYCCLFEIKFYGIVHKEFYEHPISVSHTRKGRGVIEDNGRLVLAEYIEMTITEQDFLIISKFYEWGKIEVGIFYRYVRAYLPTDLIKAILTLYRDKTELKGVEGHEDEYMSAKEKINAVFGMSVTDICRDEWIYIDDEWTKKAVNIEEAISRYNTSKKRFLSYLWGIWITAYNRKNLFTAIYECKHDYIYSDTDSVKIKNPERHSRFFEIYNKRITNKLRMACEKHKIPEEMCHPRTVKGVEKPLGVFECEGVYDFFKTLGAKRYAIVKDGKFSITVSGLNKRCAVPYMLAKYKTNKACMAAFSEDLYIPAENKRYKNLTRKGPAGDDIPIDIPTGKMTHTYIDEPREGEVTDYLGNVARFSELSSIHLEGADYSLSLSDLYIDYLLGIKHESK